MSREKPQNRQKHPPRYQEDLNPQHMAGQNIGDGGPDSIDRGEYASDRKDVMTALVEFNHDELQQIPLVRAGARLKNTATYVDVRIPGDQPFTVTGVMYAPEGRWIVPKAETPKELWQRLIERR